MAARSSGHGHESHALRGRSGGAGHALQRQRKTDRKPGEGRRAGTPTPFEQAGRLLLAAGGFD